MRAWSEAERQRQRWEKAVPHWHRPWTELISGQSLTAAFPDAKLYRRATLPLKKVTWYATHAHLKNLYMAFSYDDNCKKAPFTWERYPSESSCFALLQLSAFGHRFWTS
jgi:hypothetical protein